MTNDATHLLISDGGLFLIGQLHQRAHIRAQVCLTANEQDSCAWAEVQDLSFPLWNTKKATYSSEQSPPEEITCFKCATMLHRE